MELEEKVLGSLALPKDPKEWPQQRASMWSALCVPGFQERNSATLLALLGLLPQYRAHMPSPLFLSAANFALFKNL